MIPKPPKSAQGRIKSKKVNENKEIEEWVLSDTDFARETTRHAGQLTGNVTEERLLRARLMELGKERFKVLTKYAYERQTFIDKQKRKAELMRKSRISNNKTNSLYSGSQPILLKGDRSIDIDSLPLRGSYSPVLRPKTVQFESNIANMYITTGYDDSRPNTVPANGRFPQQNTKPTSLNNFQMETSTPMGTYNDWSRPSTAATLPTFSRSTSSSDMRDRKFNRYGSKFSGVTKDARFSKLESALSENYESNTKQNVRTIIDNIESLRRPARTGCKDARRQLEVKVKQFMEERGIVW